MKLKSRLVAMGNQERRKVRSDSSTADTKGIHLVFSFAISRKTKVCGDFQSAFFTGQPMSRVWLLWQPRSGLPSLKPRDHLLARVLVHGMQDAEHGFCQKFHRTLLGGGV